MKCLPEKKREEGRKKEKREKGRKEGRKEKREMKKRKNRFVGYLAIYSIDVVG